MREQQDNQELTIESDELRFEGMAEDRFKYWYARHEHQLLSRVNLFIKSNPEFTKCSKAEFVVDKENFKGKFVVKVTKPEVSKPLVSQ